MFGSWWEWLTSLSITDDPLLFILMWPVCIVLFTFELIACFAALLAVTSPIDAILRRDYSDDTVCFGEKANGTLGHPEIFSLSGILADGKLQSDPVRGTWLKFGNVRTYSYGTKRFDPVVQVGRIATEIHKILVKRQPKKITFILHSMGGPVGLNVWRLLKGPIMSAKGVKPEVEMVVVDGISNSANMGSNGNLAAPVMRVVRAGPIWNVLLKFPFKLLLQPPKEDEIQDGLNKKKVIRDAMAAMAPYKFSIWRDQLAYMAAYPPLKPEQFEGVTRVYYMWCSEGNVTVNQPAEMLRWKKAVEAQPGCEFIAVVVNTPHCAYAQEPAVWNRKFSQVLDGSLVTKAASDAK